MIPSRCLKNPRYRLSTNVKSAARRAEKRRALAPLRKQVTRLEKHMEKLAADKSEIEQKMADPELYEGSADALVCMQKDLGWISQQLAEAEEAWLIAHHELEAAEEGVG